MSTIDTTQGVGVVITKTQGMYSLHVSRFDQMTIRREDSDGRQRTVAHVDNFEQWDRFIAALEDGSDEVDAVHRIDEHDEEAI